MPDSFPLAAIDDALNTAFLLETGCFEPYITSRGAVDRTRCRSDTHFHRSLHRAIAILFAGLDREQQDALILAASSERKERLRNLIPASSHDRKANTAALLANLKGLKP